MDTRFHRISSFASAMYVKFRQKGFRRQRMQLCKKRMILLLLRDKGQDIVILFRCWGN